MLYVTRMCYVTGVTIAHIMIISTVRAPYVSTTTTRLNIPVQRDT
jgi:hypothetical protein